MSTVRFEISMSLDGYVTASGVRPDEPMGDGGHVLHEWAFGDTEAGRDVHADSQNTVGASIAGRRTYDLSIPSWGANGPGFDARTPTVIVSHREPDTVPAGGVYTFVRSPEEAVTTAKALTGDKDVDVFSASIGGQLLRAGLVDEVRIHLVPRTARRRNPPARRQRRTHPTGAHQRRTGAEGDPPALHGREGRVTSMDVYPSLTYRDLGKAVEVLSTTFSLTIDEVGHDESGALRYATLRHGSGRVLLQPDLPDELHGSHLGQGWVYVAVADLNAHFQRARGAGARVLNDPHVAIDGTTRGYSARDLEGNLWSFGSDRPGG